MRQCNYCGEWIEDDDLMFCPECGECLDETCQTKDDDVHQRNAKQNKREKLNKKQAIKIAFVVFGFLAVVSACICILCLT